ncbi:hypothetical protein BGZ65_006770 [Modicella reniformis]|uniref:Uncharacterized protein n=1 Tax=Modicella reniformis TaxID=1440133 RepID=A0A9P6LSG4_9FUNG|nr:hypothetical protein BGZ65_006770 [Modicella reniformis]
MQSTLEEHHRTLEQQQHLRDTLVPIEPSDTPESQEGSSDDENTSGDNGCSNSNNNNNNGDGSSSGDGNDTNGEDRSTSNENSGSGSSSNEGNGRIGASQEVVEHSGNSDSEHQVLTILPDADYSSVIVDTTSTTLVPLDQTPRSNDKIDRDESEGNGNGDDGGGGGSGDDDDDDDDESTGWRDRYVALHSLYRVRLASMHFSLCEDLHQRLLDHRHAVRQLQGNVFHRIAGLPPLFADVAHDRIMPQMVDHLERQRKCGRQIGRTLRMELRSGMLTLQTLEDEFDGIRRRSQDEDSDDEDRARDTARPTATSNSDEEVDASWTMFGWTRSQLPFTKWEEVYEARAQLGLEEDKEEESEAESSEEESEVVDNQQHRGQFQFHDLVETARTQLQHGQDLAQTEVLTRSVRTETRQRKWSVLLVPDLWLRRLRVMWSIELRNPRLPRPRLQRLKDLQVHGVELGLGIMGKDSQVARRLEGDRGNVVIPELPETFEKLEDWKIKYRCELARARQEYPEDLNDEDEDDAHCWSFRKNSKSNTKSVIPDEYPPEELWIRDLHRKEASLNLEGRRDEARELKKKRNALLACMYDKILIGHLDNLKPSPDKRSKPSNTYCRSPICRSTWHRGHGRIDKRAPYKRRQMLHMLIRK